MKRKKFKIALIIVMIIAIVVLIWRNNMVNASIFEDEEYDPEELIPWGVDYSGFDNYSDYLSGLDTDTTVTIAIIDTGINLDHEVFKGRLDLTLAKNYVTGQDENDLSDHTGHGTAVAGIIAQSTPANVKILPIKVVEKEEDMNPRYGTTLYNVFEDIGTHIDILCCSLSINTDLVANPDMFDLVDEYLEEKNQLLGTIFIGDVGDDGGKVYFSATSDFVYSASYLNEDLEISKTSCRGPEIDFALPGENLIVPSKEGKDTYECRTGSSYATAFLSSAFALVKVEHPDYDQEKIADVLKDNCIDLGDEGKDDLYGYGFIDFNSDMFHESYISVSNLTRKKATITLADDISATFDFDLEIATRSEVTTDDFYVSCIVPCFAVVSYDGGDTFQVLKATVTDETNKYKFTYNLDDYVEIYVAIKGDVDYSGLVNGIDVRLIRKEATKPGTNGLSDLQMLLYNVDSASIINGIDVRLARKEATRPGTGTKW